MRHRSFRRFSKRKFITLIFTVIICVLYQLFGFEQQRSVVISYEDNSVAQDFSKRKSLRVCTWNVHNYNVSNRRVNGRWVSYPKPESERDEIASTLAKINADVVLIQEMGDATYMQDLCERLRKAGVSYAFAGVSNYDVPSRLGILCKVKPAKVFDFSNTYFQFNRQKMYSPRGALGVKIDINSRSVYAFAIHLKSKVSAKKEDENFTPFRRAELKAIVRRITKATANDSLTIIGGDFNDEPNKYLLKSAEQFKVVAQSDLVGSNYTYSWRKKNAFYMYDYFLASENLLPYLKKGRVIAKTSVSDHRPVYVDICFEK